MVKLLLVAFLAIAIGEAFCGEVDDKFRSAKIVPDLIARAPDALLEVEFDCGFTTLGNKFTPLQVRNRPKVSWKEAKEDEFYTLIFTEIAEKGERCHWLVGNIPGNLIDKGDILTSFFPSAPYKDKGEHRYVFLLFRQPGKADYRGQVKISTFQMDGRDDFSTKVFADAFKLGVPIAGNFYLAAWDESCEEVHEFVKKNDKTKH